MNDAKPEKQTFVAGEAAKVRSINAELVDVFRALESNIDRVMGSIPENKTATSAEKAGAPGSDADNLRQAIDDSGRLVSWGRRLVDRVVAI